MFFENWVQKIELMVKINRFNFSIGKKFAITRTIKWTDVNFKQVLGNYGVKHLE